MTTALITEAQREILTANVGGGYLGLSWNLVDEEGKPIEPPVLRPGAFVVAENYYGRVILWVDDDMELIECVEAG